MLSPYALIGIVMASCLMSVAIPGSLLWTVVPRIDSWCVAHALSATASARVLIAGSLQAQFVTLAAALITLTIALLLIQGIRQFFGEVWAVPQETGVFAVVFAALMYFTFVSPNVSAKIGIVSMFFAYARIAVGTLALRHAPHDGTRYPYRPVAAAAYLGMLFHIIRAIAVAFDMPQTAFLEPSAWNALFFGLAIIMFPCMSTGMVVLAHDQLARRIGRFANIDELMGVLMRRASMTRVSILLHDVVASGKPLSIAVLVIDQLRAVNDGFGHTVGGRILKHVMLVVSTWLKSDDLIGCPGGEEFAIVVVDADKAAAVVVMDEFRLTVEHSPRQGVRRTLSVGVEHVMPGDTLAATSACADAALYLAKEKGCDRVIIASEAYEGDVETHGATVTSKLAY